MGLTSYATKAHIVRAMLEAMCFQTREVVDAMRQDADLSQLKVGSSQDTRSSVHLGLTARSSVEIACAHGYVQAIWQGRIAQTLVMRQKCTNCGCQVRNQVRVLPAQLVQNCPSACSLMHDINPFTARSWQSRQVLDLGCMS